MEIVLISSPWVALSQIMREVFVGKVQSCFLHTYCASSWSVDLLEKIPFLVHLPSDSVVVYLTYVMCHIYCIRNHILVRPYGSVDVPEICLKVLRCCYVSQSLLQTTVCDSRKKAGAGPFAQCRMRIAAISLTHQVHVLHLRQVAKLAFTKASWATWHTW